jgi:hypothetical protein
LPESPSGNLVLLGNLGLSFCEFLLCSLQIRLKVKGPVEGALKDVPTTAKQLLASGLLEGQRVRYVGRGQVCCQLSVAMNVLTHSQKGTDCECNHHPTLNANEESDNCLADAAWCCFFPTYLFTQKEHAVLCFACGLLSLP